jgi:cytochrome b involved in lipid metabolism
MRLSRIVPSSTAAIQFLTNSLSFTFAHLLITGGPKVYDVTDYLDDHPGGAEVLLDVGGQDADEFFEDIGHSKDARDELKKILVGTLKLDEAELNRRAEAARIAAERGAGGMNMMVIFFAIIAIVAAYYKTQM